MLETEHHLFGNQSEDIMDEMAKRAALKLTYIEKSTLIIDRRMCYKKRNPRDSLRMVICKGRPLGFYVKFYVQCKEFERYTRTTEEST